MVNIKNVQHVWHILNRAKKTTTYGDVAKKLGYTDKRAGRILWRYLWIIGDYCVRNHQPPLNAIVIRQDIGKPGDGVLLRKGRTVQDEIRAVLQKPSRLSTPTPEIIEKTWTRLRKTMAIALGAGIVLFAGHADAQYQYTDDKGVSKVTQYKLDVPRRTATRPSGSERPASANRP